MDFYINDRLIASAYTLKKNIPNSNTISHYIIVLRTFQLNTFVHFFALVVHLSKYQHRFLNYAIDIYQFYNLKML